MNKYIICLSFLFVFYSQANSQTHMFSATRNSVAKLELSVQKKESKDAQLKLVNEGIKSGETARQHRKTRKYAETWALLGYLYSYKLSIDDKADLEELLDKTTKILDTAESMDKEGANSKYLEAARHNVTLKNKILAQAAFNAKDFERSLQLYKSLSNQFPKDTIYAINGAVSANFLQRRTEAIDFMKRAEANNAQNATIYQSLGNWYAARQETDKAIQVFEKGLKFNPSNLFLNNEYINVLLDSKQYEKAAQAIEVNLASFSSSDRMNYLYGYVNHQLNNLPAARNYYTKSIDLNNYNYDAHYQLGLVYVDLFKINNKQEDLQEAIRNIRNAYNLKPNDKTVIRLLLDLYTYDNKTAEIQDLRRKLIEL